MRKRISFIFYLIISFIKEFFFIQLMAEIKQGDLLDIKIEFAGKKGDGVAKMNDYVIFVPNVKEGDDLNVKITKVLDNVAFAEVAK